MAQVIRVEKAESRDHAERRKLVLESPDFAYSEVRIFEGPGVATAVLELDDDGVLRTTDERVAWSSSPFVVLAIR